MQTRQERIHAVLMAETPDYTEAIRAFHMMWDSFPGMARLVNKKHTIIAANAEAVAMGYTPGIVCATVKNPEMHRGCQLWAVLGDAEAKLDTETPGMLRGWLPVQDYPDLCINFMLRREPSQE